jgi:hypothetical protein
MELETSSVSDLSDKQLQFLHTHKISGDRLQIALAIDKEARKQGINPEFVFPMVMQESKFSQDTVSPKGAIGVMQLMEETAKGLKVDPNDLQQNIKGGISLLKELMSNEKIGGDPYKVLAGYNASTETRNKFYESGDLADLPDETIKHMHAIGKFYGGTLPSVSYSAPVTETPTQDQTAKNTEENKDENIYRGRPVTDYADTSATTPAEMGVMTGALGTGLGSIYTAKAPAVRLAQRVGLLPGGKPISPTEAAELVEKVMTPTSQTETPQKTHGGQNWQKSLTGISLPNAQMDKASLDLAKAMQSAVGAQGAPGFTGGMITEGGLIVNPQDAEAIRRKALLDQMANERVSGINERLNQVISKKDDLALQKSLQGGQANAAQRVAQSIMGSSPVRGGLAGLGVGYNVQDAFNKFNEGDILSGGLSTGAAGASALSLAPKLASKMNPLAIGLTTASQVAGDLRRGDRQSAAESALAGLATLAPRVLGAPAAAIYSSGLNKDEARELDRRRSLPPTITP